MKKHHFIISIVLVLTILTGYAQVKYFKTDVDTQKKPWINLDFYNDLANFQFAIVSDRNGGN